MLEVRSVWVRYGTGGTLSALSHVSFSLAGGEALGVLGESGCGKSTLAKALLGLLPPQAQLRGSIQFRGQELVGLDEPALRKLRGARVTLIAQDPAQALNPVLTIGTQIDEVLRSHTALPSAERAQRVLESLRNAGVDDPAALRKRYPHQLSGGERQRAAIAQAIVCRPELLVADEPTTKLDARLRQELLDLFRQLRVRHKMALLLISHDPGALARYTDRLLVMYASQIVESGATAELLRSPLHPYSSALAKLARERRLQPRPGQESARRFAAIAGEPGARNDAGCCFEPRCPDRMATCATRRPMLAVRGASSIGTRQEVACLKYES